MFCGYSSQELLWQPDSFCEVGTGQWPALHIWLHFLLKWGEIRNHCSACACTCTCSQAGYIGSLQHSSVWSRKHSPLLPTAVICIIHGCGCFPNNCFGFGSSCVNFSHHKDTNEMPCSSSGSKLWLSFTYLGKKQTNKRDGSSQLETAKSEKNVKPKPEAEASGLENAL